MPEIPTLYVCHGDDGGPRVHPCRRVQEALREKGIEYEKVIEAVQKEVDAANEQLARVEQIKKFTILPSDWEPGGDELTPTMKLKRKPIHEKYADEIEELYSG